MDEHAGQPLRIDEARLKHRIRELGQIGRDEDGGMHRPAFSEGDMQAREWLADELGQAGLDVCVDPAANICGRYRCEAGEPRVITGSHIDTVPRGGQFDGALGVLVGLECIQRLKELGTPLRRGLEVIAFTDEEGRFGGLIGSEALSGQLSMEEVRAARDLNGVALKATMAEAGFDADRLLEAERPADEVHAYLELHIEQGPVLEQLQIPVGAVTGITGLFKWQVSFEGQSNHAGTTPMDMRKDAFTGVVEFGDQLQRIIDEYGTRNSRATIGWVELKPGAPNVIPGRATFSFEVRDTSADILADLAAAYRRSLSAIARKRGLMMNFEVLNEIEPVACDSGLLQRIRTSAEALGLAYHDMPSGAAHDCQSMAHMTRAAMVFVPSKNGISHSPREWTAFADIAAGANVFLNTLADVATES